MIILIFTKKNYNSANVRNKEKRGRDYKQFEVIDNGDQEPKSSKKEETKIKKPDEIQKPIWIKLSREEFNSLIKDVDDNLNNDEFKTTVDKKAYDEKWKKATPKISEKETIKLYSDLIIPDIAVLEESKGKAKDKRNNILNVLENLKPAFTDLTGQFFIMTMCLNQNQKKALRKEQNWEGKKIVEKDKMIDPKLFRKYFEYLSRSDMYKNLNKTTGSEENKAQVNTIKDWLTNLMEEFKSNPTSDARKINNTLNIVERILEFNLIN